MAKGRTKKDLVKEKLQANIEDIWAMEIVRDSNKRFNTPKALTEIKSAELRIKQNEENIVFLKEYLKQCE